MSHHIVVKIFRIVLFVVFGCLFVKDGLQFNPNFWLLIAAIFSMVMILRDPKKGIIFLVFFVYVIDGILSFFETPRQISWIKDVLIILLFLGAFTKRERTKILRNDNDTIVDTLVIGLLATSVFSILYNSSSAMGIITGLRRPLLYILFFYAVVWLRFEAAFFERIVKIIFVISLVQIPVAMLQFFIWRYVPSAIVYSRQAWGISDFAVGTFGIGSTGVLSIFLICIAGIAYGFYRVKNHAKKYLMLLLILLTPLIFTSSMASFLYIPLLFVFLSVIESRIKFGNVVTGLLIIVAVFVFYFSTMPTVWRQYGEERNLTEYIMDYEKIISSHSNPQYVGSGKISTMKFVLNSFQGDFGRFLLGTGPGSWQRSEFLSYKETRYDIYTANQLAETIGELGFVGFAIYLLLIYRLYRMNREFFRVTKDIFWKSVSFGFFGIVFLFVATTLYIKPWYASTLAFLFWFIAAGILSLRGRVGSDQETEE